MDNLRSLNQPRTTGAPAYTLTPVGDAWTVGPAGIGTRRVVDLSEIPEAILALDAALARAEHIVAVAA